MTTHNPQGLFDRTLRRLRIGWRSIAGNEYDAAMADLRPDLPAEDAKRLRKQMQDCLDSRGGEVSARAKAAALGHAYLALGPEGRAAFLRILAEDFDVDHAAVADKAVELARLAPGKDPLPLERELRELLQAPRIKLLTRFNALPEGVKFLVDLRADLLPLAREDTLLMALDDDLRALLVTWFDVDFLELRQITWNNAPAALLEKLVAYEAVHEIRSWQDLKNRLESDRRCFAFFHPRMPEEPLIFVEVALVNGLAGNVQELLDESAPTRDPATADTAIFYSISNAQKGLAGISFGNFLIKRVVDRLSSELNGLKTFATLSPVPGFVPWLDTRIAEGDPGLLTQAERKTLNAIGAKGRGAKGVLRELVHSTDWPADEGKAEALRAPLLRLCARYLIEEKRPNGTALDPVAHFHLSNGARLERFNWLGDRSEKGLRQSAGIMVNYLYKLGEIEDNHERYKSTGDVSASSSARGLLKG